jgi:hypothetical protein
LLVSLSHTPLSEFAFSASIQQSVNQSINAAINLTINAVINAASYISIQQSTGNQSGRIQQSRNHANTQSMNE